MVIIGIDPGNNGGVAVIQDNKRLLATYAMPKKPDKDSKTGSEIDFYCLSLILGKWKDKDPIVVIEQLTGRGGWSATSTFKLGRNYQACIDAAEGWRMPTYYVRPQKWQSHFPKLRRCKHRDDSKLRAGQASKLRAYQAVKMIWKKPSTREKFFKVATNKKVRNQRAFHDGIVDALCIAYWGLKHICESNMHCYVPIHVKNDPIFKIEKDGLYTERPSLYAHPIRTSECEEESVLKLKDILDNETPEDEYKTEDDDLY